MTTRRALFLDRDGVINRETGYLSRPEEVVWMPGLWPLCAAAQAAGFVLIAVTNQSGIARGLYSEADFDLLMRWMQQQFQEHQVALTAYYFCPHHPEHGVGDYRRECPSRKPGPGMLLQAAREHAIDLAASVMIGDRCSDVAAANTAGVGRVFLLEGTEPGTEPMPIAPGEAPRRACSGSYEAAASLAAIATAMRL